MHHSFEQRLTQTGHKANAQSEHLYSGSRPQTLTVITYQYLEVCALVCVMTAR